MFPILKYITHTLALHEHGIAMYKSTTTNTGERDMSLFNESTMEWWKAVMHLKACAGLLAGFLPLVHLCFLLMLEVAPRWFGCAFLAHTSHAGYMPIPGLRVLLRCRAGWLWFLRMTAFLLASCIFGVRGTLLWWMLNVCTFLQHCHWKRAQSRAFINVPLHLLTWQGYSTEAGPTHEIHAVMCANNVVEVGWIILDDIRAEWATQVAGDS